MCQREVKVHKKAALKAAFEWGLGGCQLDSFSLIRAALPLSSRR